MTSTWKRGLSLFVALMMIVSIIPFNALAEEVTPENTETQTPVENETEAPTAPTDGEIPAGEVSRGMYSTSNNRIQGAVMNANPKNSVVLELYSGGTKIATTTLTDLNYLANAATELTWSFCITDTSSSWSTVWEEGHPVSYAKPDKVVLYIDNTMVAENIVTLHKDNFDMAGEEAVWAELDGVSYLYTISSADELQEFAFAVKNGDTFAGKTVKLTADIDLGGMDWPMIGSYGAPFSGEFDGNGKTISNLTDSTANDHKGLFAHLNEAYVHDLYLKDVSFSGICEGALYAGALVAEAESKNVIENVKVHNITWTITSKSGSIGSIAGYSYDTVYVGCTVQDATFNVISTSSVNMGGMVGQGRGVGTFTTAYGNTETTSYVNCAVDNVTFDVTGKTTVGGFLGCDGYNHWANYGANCSVTNLTVNCAADDAQYTVGGFMGSNNGANYGKDYAFVNCSTSGVINAGGNSNIASTFGGFVGYVGGRPTALGECTANVTISVSAGDVGGFCGETQQYFAHAYEFNGCAATGDVSTNNGNAGGFIANVQHGGDGSALNTTITGCTASGSVTTTNGVAGGIIANVNDVKKDNPTGGDVTVSGNTNNTNVTTEVGSDVHDLAHAPYVATIGEQGYESLAEAIAAVQDSETIVLAAGTHKWDAGWKVQNKAVTFTGTDAVIDMTNVATGQNTSGATLNFNGVTVKFATANYKGFQHTAKVTYTDCTIEGTQFLYAPEVSFTGCTFTVTGDAYAVWTYGASNVTFENCEFNTDGKAILVYTEAAHTAEINVSGCTFVAGTNREKAAIEVGQSAYGNKANYTVNITESTADENFVANMSTSNLWGNKNLMDSEGLNLVVDETTVTLPAAFINRVGYATLADAIAAAKDGDIITLAAGTHTMPGTVANKNITIKGGKDAVVDMTIANGYRNASGSTIAFEGITANFGNTTYNGLAHSTKITYTDCVINGQQTLYATDVAFTNCTFNAEGNNYSIWTWGAKNVTFADCVFNSDGKSVLVYGYGPTDVTLTNCEFHATSNRSKAAVELGDDYGATYTVKINSCTADANFVANNTDSNLWGNKNNMTTDSGSSVTIDGSDNLIPAPPAVAKIGNTEYASIQDAIDNKTVGDVIVVIGDNVVERGIVVKADKTVEIDLNGKTVDVDIMNYGTLTVKNGTIKNTNAKASAIENNGANAKLVVEGLSITSERHAIRVDGGTAKIVSGEYVTIGQATVYAVNISTGATVEIINGTFKGAKETGTNEATAAIKIRESSTVTIANGNFSGGVLGTLQCDDSSTIRITGGTYDEDPSAYVAEGYVAEASATTEGWFTVVEDTAVAEINGKKYDSLNAAMLAAFATEGNVTVTVLQDAEFSLTIDEQMSNANGMAMMSYLTNVTLDLNGKNASVKTNMNVMYGDTLTITGNGHMTFVENGNITVMYADAYKTTNSGLIVGNGTFTNNTQNRAIIVSTEAYATINGGTFTGNSIIASSYNSSVITINAGDFTEATLEIKNNPTVTKAAGLTVKAPEGYEWKDNTTLTQIHYVAQIGETKYETFVEAYQAASRQGGTLTITLLDDAAFDSGSYFWTGKVNLTIDLNGNDLTFNTSMSVPGSFYGGNTLIITDSAETDGKMIFNNDSFIELTSDYADTLIIEAGIFVKESGSKAIIRDTAWGTVNQTITINGGDFSGVAGEVLDIDKGDTVTKAAGLTVKAPEGYEWVDNKLVPKVYVAQVGETKYESLQEAINVGGEVTLLADVALTEGLKIAAGQEVVLNLDGHTISYASSEAKANAAITNRGNLTINGKGKITYESSAPSAAFAYGTNTITNEGGTLTINSATIENTTNGGSSVAIDNNSTIGNTTLTVKNSTVTSVKVAIRQFVNSNTYTNDVTIDGSEVTGAYAAQLHVASGTAPKASLTVNGDSTLTATSEAKPYAVYAWTSGSSYENVVVKLNDGTYNGVLAVVGNGIPSVTKGSEVAIKAPEGYKWENDTTLVEQVTGTITQGCMSTVTETRTRLTGELTASNTGDKLVIELYSGETKIATSTLVNADYIGKDDVTLSWNFVIKGEESSSWKTEWVEGYFSADYEPTKVVLVIDGEKIAENTVTMNANNDLAGTWYNWADFFKTYVAQIGETKYETLDEALNNAKSGDVVEVITDIDNAGTLMIRPGVTLNIGAHTVKADYVVGLKGSMITGIPQSKDSTVPYAKLIVAQDSVVMPEGCYNNGTYDVLPVYNPAGYYEFSYFRVRVISDGVELTEESLYFQFVVDASGVAKADLLANGASDNGISIVVRLTWTTATGTAYQDFVFADEHIEAVFAPNSTANFYIRITGYQALGITGENLVVSGVVISETGAESAS